jgi:DNA helicase-2/ATP-dependent DNA helicase PcrA
MKRDEKAFLEGYNRLNKAQKQAVDTIDGPVMVVAGPGTGKTQILSLRIANILRETDTDPENILALTFTESGVASMRKRLSEIIGSSAYSVVIKTFHGFANDVIKDNPESFGRIIGSKNITDVNQISLIEEIIIESKLDLLKPFGDTLYYTKAINSAISDLKREGVSVADFEEIVTVAERDFENISDLYHEKGAHKGKMKSAYQDLKKQINKNKELLSVYKSYEEKLVKNKQYDYNDMIMEVLKSLRADGDLLLRLQETHQYILVDEHQDTNNAQNKILELLVNFHESPNIFVVGDEKQSIFKFQGASLENFFYFKHLYKNAKLVTLEENYRSTQKILDSAHSLLAGDKKLKSNKKEEEKNIHFYTLPNDSAENYFLASSIEEKIKDGVNPYEIAVLYKNNKDAFPVADMLSRFGVPYVIESDQDILRDSYVKKLVTIINAVENFGNDDVLAEMLHLDIFEISPIDLVRVIRTARDKRKFDLYDVLADKEKMLSAIPLEDIEKFREAYGKLSSWVKSSKNDDLIVCLERIFRESGLLALALSHSPEKLETINTFFDEARSLVAGNPVARLSDFYTYIETLKKHSLSIKRKSKPSSLAVRLMTVHRSKGLEFEYVYITGAYDGHFGNKSKREILKLLPSVYKLVKDQKENDFDYLDGDSDSEERRLFYVALTRAKKEIHISYASFGDEGRERVPSQFISEIDESLIDVEDTDNLKEKISKDKSIFFKEKARAVSSADYKEKYKEFVREKFLSQGLSVSALNNYLKSPWLYFYRNLVRLPEAQNKSQIYGTVIHGVLQDFFESLKYEKPGKEFLLSRFEDRLSRESLRDHDRDDLLDKGHKTLEGWYAENKGKLNADVLTEFRVNGVYLSPEIRLTGVLDKLEYIDGSRRRVRVVDYKTGKPKSEKVVRGETKDSNGEYYRQIVFYKLLLELYEDGKFVMDEGALEFVEADEKGKFTKHIFHPTDEEVQNLKSEIIRVSDEILNLKFWDTPCDPKEMGEGNEKYCELVEEIKRRG